MRHADKANDNNIMLKNMLTSQFLRPGQNDIEIIYNEENKQKALKAKEFQNKGGKGEDNNILKRRRKGRKLVKNNVTFAQEQ